MLTARIGQYDSDPDPYFAERDDVRLDDIALKCVAFIGIKRGDRFVPRATCFFVSQIQFQHQFCSLVTAEHVVSGLLSKGHDLWMRINVHGPKGAVVIPIRDATAAFYFHPDNESHATDVAVSPMPTHYQDEKTGELHQFDINYLQLTGHPDNFVPNETFKEKVGLGSDVAVIGLFRSHFGENRNVPIVRIGNISALPGEPVYTKYAGYLQAYLVESRSISGLSGSPVFAVADTALFVVEALAQRGMPKTQHLALLGLMHGHFDVPNLNEDVVSDDDMPERSVHTGIGVVIPIEKIIETLNHPDLIAMRKKTVERLRDRKGATPDLIDEADLPASDENPNHREDFTRLLGEAARIRKSED
jgi:hypothetical protein